MTLKFSERDPRVFSKGETCCGDLAESGQGSRGMRLRSSCSYFAKLVGDGKASPGALPPPPPFSYSSFLYGDKIPEEEGIFFFWLMLSGASVHGQLAP